MNGRGKKRFYYFHNIWPLLLFLFSISLIFPSIYVLSPVALVIGFFFWLPLANHTIMKHKPKYSSTLFITVEQCRKPVLCASCSRHLCISSSMGCAIFTAQLRYPWLAQAAFKIVSSAFVYSQISLLLWTSLHETEDISVLALICQTTFSVVYPTCHHLRANEFLLLLIT